MWIFTVQGFFTIIQDRKDANYVWLRARLREDIERNFPGVTAEVHPGADYLFRVKLPREQVAQRLFELAMENNVTSHFKDVMIRTASVPKHGSRSNMLYGVWNAGAAMQPYAPYSKNPRPEPIKHTYQPAKHWTGSSADRRPGTDQQGLYGGMGAGYHASEFDWDSRSWGGTSAPDPGREVKIKGSTGKPVPGPQATDEEFEEWWGGLSDAERDEYLDAAEADQRAREELEEDFGAAARAAEHRRASEPVVADYTPDPRSRSGNRKQRRKERRQRKDGRGKTVEQRTRDNQRLGLSFAEAQRAAQDRQTFLDRKYGKGKA